METQTLDLSCTVKGKSTDENKFWKTCEWKHGNVTTCTLNSNGKGYINKTQCHESMKAAYSKGRNNLECRISIPSVVLSYNGIWTCRLEKCKDVADGGCEDKSSCAAEANVNILVFYAYFIISNEILSNLCIYLINSDIK